MINKNKQLNFNDKCSYHIETSQLICLANQLTGFPIVGTWVINELTYISF